MATQRRFSHITVRSTLASLLACGLASPAFAQATADQAGTADTSVAAAAQPAPQWVVVTAPAMPIRSGPMDRFYPMLMVDPTRPLAAMGEQDSWLKVRLPAGTRAFVKADEASLTGATTVTLTTPSRLRAAHLTGGLGASWRSLLDAPLPVGTDLTLVETITEGTTTIGYAVLAPAGATGFVAKNATRVVTGDELDRLRQAAPATTLPTSRPAAPQTDTPAPSTQAPASSTPPAPPAGAQPGNADTSLLEPMVVPSSEPQPAEQSQPRPEQTQTPANAQPGTRPNTQPTNQPSNQPTNQPNAQPAAQPSAPTAQSPTSTPAAQPQAPADGASADEARAPRPTLTLEELDAAYERMKNLPLEEAELNELRIEYERALRETPSDGFSERLRQQLANRLAFIDARIRVRDLRLRTLRESSETPAELAALRERIAAVQASGRFDVVGELVPSSLYDGTRLPRLIAVRSRDGYGRTVGYLSPTPEVIDMLGQLVGIEGSTAIDEELGVRLITIRRMQAIPRD